MRTKKRIYTEFLPPTPCTTTMKDEIVNFASESGISLAEAMRQSIAFFLSEKDTKSIAIETESIGDDKSIQ